MDETMPIQIAPTIAIATAAKKAIVPWSESFLSLLPEPQILSKLFYGFGVVYVDTEDGKSFADCSVCNLSTFRFSSAFHIRLNPIQMEIKGLSLRQRLEVPLYGLLVPQWFDALVVAICITPF
jgi:hypothetical protein